MSKSIIQNDKECYICHTTANLHEHHIFFGSGNRKNSEHYGFKCYLCARHHNMSEEGVHFNKSLDVWLKRVCQDKFERTHTRTEFMSIIGKNYLTEDSYYGRNEYGDQSVCGVDNGF